MGAELEPSVTPSMTSSSESLRATLPGVLTRNRTAARVQLIATATSARVPQTSAPDIRRC